MIDTAYFRLLAAQPAHRRLAERTRDWISARLDRHCYVSWSAGKDSMVVAHLCVAIRPDIPVLMVDPGVPIHWTEQDRTRMLIFNRTWNVRMFQWNKFAHARPDNEGEYRRSVHADQFAQLTEYAQQHALTRRITGIRAAESNARAHVQRETSATLQPIRDWSTDDVWAYTVKHELPWLSIYDHLGPESRNGLIGRNGREHGRLAYLRKYYPDTFRLACELLPETRANA